MPTYGSSAPQQLTINYDALLATSLFNYRPTLVDNISNGSPFFFEMKQRMRGEDGGLAIQETLMYTLGDVDTYSGYDELGSAPTDGITSAFFDWSQAAAPVSISGKEEKQNKHRIVKLVEAKIKQAELGFQEFYNKYFLQGNISQVGGALYTPFVSTKNGSLFVDPLPKLVDFDPTASRSVGGINQNTYSWWRNKTATSAASTNAAFMKELDSLFNDCSIGPYGKPNFIICDKITWEVWRAAYYAVYRRVADSADDYPFPNFYFNGVKVLWDQYVPDAYTGVASTATYGTVYMLNLNTMNFVYEEATNFVSTPFVKPPLQDAKISHIMWMGAVTCNNRRKNGVLGKVARSLS